MLKIKPIPARRASNSFQITSFADPHALSPLESHRLKNRGGRRVVLSRSSPLNTWHISPSPLLSIDCALFFATAHFQPLCHQSLPHSLSFNGRGGCSRHSLTPSFEGVTRYCSYKFPYILPSYVSSKSFICHSCKKHRGGTSLFPFWDRVPIDPVRLPTRRPTPDCRSVFPVSLLRYFLTSSFFTAPAPPPRQYWRCCPPSSPWARH